MKTILKKPNPFLLVGMLLWTTTSIGQSLLSCDDISYSVFSYAKPQMNQTKAATSSFYYELPFILKNRLLIVEAEVDGVKGNFIIDTGIEEIILNSKRKLQTMVALDFCDVGNQKQRGKIKNIQLQLANKTFKNQRAFVIDLRHLESGIHYPIMGLIGRKVLENFEFHLDYRHFKIHFYHLDKYGNKKIPLLEMSIPIDTIPIMMKGQLPYIKATLDEKIYRFGLDTGAGINIFAQKLSKQLKQQTITYNTCLLYTSPSPRDQRGSRMPSSA